MSKLDDLTKVEGYLTGLGWPVSRLAPDTVRSTFRGSTSNLSLMVKVEDGWVKLTVIPITRMPAETDRAEQLYQRLLTLNGQIMLARFSLDEDGDVLLSVEFPVADCDPSELKDSLDVLTYYAEKHASEIRAMVAAPA